MLNQLSLNFSALLQDVTLNEQESRFRLELQSFKMRITSHSRR